MSKTLNVTTLMQRFEKAVREHEDIKNLPVDDPDAKREIKRRIFEYSRTKTALRLAVKSAVVQRKEVGL